MYQLILLMAATVGADGDFRTWTATTGHTVVAEYIGFRNGLALLRTVDGGVTTIPTTKLIDADREEVLRHIRQSPRMSQPSRYQPSHLVVARRAAAREKTLARYQWLATQRYRQQSRVNAYWSAQYRYFLHGR